MAKKKTKTRKGTKARKASSLRHYPLKVSDALRIEIREAVDANPAFENASQMIRTFIREGLARWKGRVDL